MSNHPYLIVDFQQFRDNIQSLILSAKSLMDGEIRTNEALEQFKSDKKSWENEVINVFESSFSGGENIFLNSFLETRSQLNFHLTQIGSQRPLHILVKDVKDNLNLKIFNIKDTIIEINQCEYILDGEKFDLASRSKFTTKQKLGLLLHKLHELNDGRYYSIEMLLMGNGITCRNHNEPRELSKILENNGYVELIGGLGSDMSARITSHGTIQIEEQLEPHNENYSDIPNVQEILNEKMAEIIEILNTQGLGQEILFNELQELKEQFGKLNKKNWGQLLKGKLVDLALAKAVNTETLKFVYEHLTGHAFKLL